MPPSPDILDAERDPRSRFQDAPQLDHMFLLGVEVHGHHGVFDFERQAGQRFIVDLDWCLDTSAAALSDELGDAVCYKQIHDCTVAVTAGEPWCLIETLAACLSRTLLATFPSIDILQVTVHKPEAPIGGVFADVGITLTRRRADAVSPRERT